MPRLLKAYLDTNILIEYIWITSFATEERKTSAYTLVNRGARGEYEIYISYYTIVEVSQHFIDYFLQQKAIKRGFSFREFPRVRRNFTLTEEEIRTISDIVEILRTNVYLNYIHPVEIEGEFFRILMEYVRGCIDFMDALHLRTAIDVGCDYFVTKDGELRKRIQYLINEKVITEPIKVTSVSGFLNILNIRKKQLETRKEKS